MPAAARLRVLPRPCRARAARRVIQDLKKLLAGQQRMEAEHFEALDAQRALQVEAARADDPRATPST